MSRIWRLTSLILISTWRDNCGRRLPCFEMEKQEVLDALKRNNWIQSHAAKELGITLRQMGYRVKKFDLEEIVKRKRFAHSVRCGPIMGR